jgi:transposase-like protein
VQQFTPLLAEAARPCRHAVGDRWWADETYVKVAGRWRYVYRAIDQFGQGIDVFVSTHRDVKAARRFFQRAIGITKGTPVEVVTDRAPAFPLGHCCIEPEAPSGCLHSATQTRQIIDTIEWFESFLAAGK